ncbi:polysaccharide deacetylase family protein [Cohnella thermotolerans]|uniref:polysaccharide deacetylase family protein n=1 Tax=Cohnella thermotolerans TaxID=329858 RepID=UPI0003FF587C|nr:polysaccharide deacetylase family protein [Cohnella thermotolerans]
MDRILWWLFYFLTFYAFIPGFVSRAFGFRAFRRGLAKREIALTFDDGPDPVYTPQLLDLLRKYEAKATFFVVGAHAEKHPEIILRMHEEGHTIGIHNYVHRSNWMMSPRTVKRQVQRTSDIIEGITGVRPIYYRPPWGIVNVFDFAQLRHMQIVLWTSMFGDWKEKVGVDKLYRKMRDRLAPGQVFLLHDRGDTFGADPEAPAHTIQALERLLREARERKLAFVGIGELMAITEENRALRKAKKQGAAAAGGEASGARSAPRRAGPFKRLVVSLWMLWEKLFHVTFRLRPIGDGSFMYYRIVKYSGPELTLRDGSRLRRGDRVAELHFDNATMMAIGTRSKSAIQIAIRLIREVKATLPDVARELNAIPQSGEVKAIYGVSMVNQGAENLGFDTFALPKGLFAKATNWYLKLLMRIIHPDGSRKISKHSDKLEPRIIVMGRETLNGWAKPSAAEAEAEAQEAEAKQESAAAAAREADDAADAGMREEMAFESLS